MKEVRIGNVNDIKNGEMKSVKIGDEEEILLTKIEGNFYATGAHCTHYGAPLADGILNGDTIVCPWHHACFNAKNGNFLEPPAFDSLPKFEIRIEGEEIIALLPDELPSSRTPEMANNDGSDSRVFAIVGAGASAYMAAQAMREGRF